MIIATSVLILLVIISVGYFSGQLMSNAADDEELYYENLYTISTKLISTTPTVRGSFSMTMAFTGL